jgi:two-component system invasion response regulator UvrY
MIRVLIADDHPVVRRGLKNILTTEIQGAECGEAENAQEVLDEVGRSEWDVIILDISMPGRSGLDLLKQLARDRPKLPVLVLSTYPESQYGARALMAGAFGYMHKESAPDDLVRAVRHVLTGRRYLTPAMAEILADKLRPNIETPPHESLSDRELELLRLFGAGKSTRQVASLLNLSPSTVSTYRARVLQKMKMKTTAELMHYAISNGLAD